MIRNSHHGGTLIVLPPEGTDSLAALDAEGHEKVLESVESVGQRHRSAYRLCSFVHDAVAIVVSQDGTVRFVKWHDGVVTYWDNVATSVLDV